jgi:hypothetical protein
VKDSTAFVRILAPTLRLKIRYTVYQRDERSTLYLVFEAADEKAYGTSGVDVSSNGGKELKGCRTFH